METGFRISTNPVNFLQQLKYFKYLRQYSCVDSGVSRPKQSTCYHGSRKAQDSMFCVSHIL